MQRPLCGCCSDLSERNYILHFELFKFLCLQIYELFLLVRSVVILPVTENALAKWRINWTKSSILDET